MKAASADRLVTGGNVGTRQRPRPNGSGGLWIIKRKRWNEAKQLFEIVELYQRGVEIKEPGHAEGKRKWVTGTGRSPEEAERRLQKALERRGHRQAMQNMGLIENKPKGGLRLEDYLLNWHAEISENDVGPSMRLKYFQHLNNHIIPHIGQIPLAQLGHRELRELFEKTLPAKKRVRAGVVTDEPLLGSSGLLNVYKTLNRALNIAVAEGLIQRNPMALIKAPRFQRPEENIANYMHIVRGMFAKMKREGNPLHDYFYLALLGLRRGERLGLAWSNVKLSGDNPHIIIKQQLQRVSGIGIHIKPSTKSGTERRITLDGEFLQVMLRLKELRKLQVKESKFKPSPEYSDLVFLTNTGKPIDPNTDNDKWREVLQVNRSPVHIRQHALRHVTATSLADLNVPESVAKSILGHSSSSLVSYYGRDTDKKNKQAIREYAKQLSGE